MPVSIPITSDPRQRFRTTLAGQAVTLQVWWQPSDKAWYLSLFQGDTPIVVSVRLVEDGATLLGLVTDFAGQLQVQGDGDPGRDSWQESHALWYYTAAEWDAL